MDMFDEALEFQDSVDGSSVDMKTGQGTDWRQEAVRISAAWHTDLGGVSYAVWLDAAGSWHCAKRQRQLWEEGRKVHRTRDEAVSWCHNHAGWLDSVTFEGLQA